MKHSINLTTTFFLLSILLFVSCQKEIEEKQSEQQEELITAANREHGHLVQTNKFSATVAQKWQDLQNKLLRTPTTASVSR